MDVCTIETGLLRKKPCGHAAVTRCLNCEQPLCGQHAVPELTEGGKRSGKFLCQECAAAAKAHDKGVAAAERVKQDKKMAAMQKAAVETAKAPPPAPKKPAAPAGAPAAKEESPAAKPAEPEALEFTREPDAKVSGDKPG